MYTKSKLERLIRNSKADLAFYKKRVALLKRELDHYENMLDLAEEDRYEEMFPFEEA